MKPPVCKGYHIHSVNGDDFDCGYGATFTCEQCLCNYLQTGGRYSPVNGRHVRESTAVRMYGKQYIPNRIVRRKAIGK